MAKVPKILALQSCELQGTMSLVEKKIMRVPRQSSRIESSRKETLARLVVSTSSSNRSLRDTVQYRFMRGESTSKPRLQTNIKNSG